MTVQVLLLNNKTKRNMILKQTASCSFVQTLIPLWTVNSPRHITCY